MMQIKFNINNYILWRVCRSLAACRRHTPSSLAAAIGLSNNDVISLRSLSCVRCVGWKPLLSVLYHLSLISTPHIPGGPKKTGPLYIFPNI